jgi:hypothetical protein
MFTVYHAHGEMPFPTKQQAWAYIKQLVRKGITDLCVHDSNNDNMDTCVFGTWKFYCDDKVYFCLSLDEVFILDGERMPVSSRLERWSWKLNAWQDANAYLY